AGDGVRDLAHAPVWGLLRAARAEHPERSLRLVDLGGALSDAERALAVAGEPELAVRDGEIRAARLVPAAAATASAPERRLDPEGA
ncbi:MULTISPECIES: SpnB-like Rossmann fold domain-containing protein, partial [unclassified Streptomyces]|uniref:SpnB-like Rossmann fold domain-containing protein n=1 Tax=unclassified Streptomyces TaxID=2593676 RepID=UPI0040420460